MRQGLPSPSEVLSTTSSALLDNYCTAEGQRNFTANTELQAYRPTIALLFHILRDFWALLIRYNERQTTAIHSLVDRRANLSHCCRH